jgi:RHS repeat-associated protein
VQRTTSTVFDAVGNVSFVTNPRGYITSYGFDALNRVVQQIDAFGNALQRTLTTVFDAVGNVLSVTNPLGVQTSYGYDNLNRQVSQVAAYGTSLQETTTAVYDADDNLIAGVDALGYRTTYGYDALNRQTSQTAPDGGISTAVYDANNNVVNTIDPLGHKSTLVYDVLYRNTQTTDARGGIVTQIYDANDNLLSLIDPVANVTAWLYDLFDRQVQETDPLGNSATVAYDAADRQTSVTDRLGQVIASSYDALNRKTGESWYNAAGSLVSTLTFTLDANNNLLSAANGNGVQTASYDALDRPIVVQSPFAAVLTNSYDAADNRTLVQDSQGGVATWVFDALNRVVTILFSGNSATLREDFAYTARDQVSNQTRYSNLAGTSTVGSSSMSYDGVGRLTNLVHQNGTGATLAYFVNAFDLAGRITSETLNGGTPTSYGYDATDELTNDSVKTYSYDLNGNRTMAGYSTGPANEMTSDGTWSYFYDKNGNVVAKINPSTGEAWAFAYDNRNRLISAQDVISGLQMQGTYVYDALGKRIEKDVWTQSSGNSVTRFACESGEIWADLNSTNGLQIRYLRGSGVLELLARVSNGAIVAWFLLDRMGSVRNIVDNAGTNIDTITYDGFGNIIAESNTGNGGDYVAFGYRDDKETGWLRPDLSTARYHDASTGRWGQVDPSGYAGGDSNLYRYVGNQPTNWTDPSGLAAPPLYYIPFPPPGNVFKSQFGEWKIEQRKIDGLRGSPWGCFARITFTPNKKQCNADVIAFVQIVRSWDLVGTRWTPTTAHAGPNKIAFRTLRSGWAIDRQPTKYAWYGFTPEGEPEPNPKPSDVLGEKIRQIRAGASPGRKGLPFAPAVLEDAPGDPAGRPYIRVQKETEFETYAVAKAGKDKGRIYGGIKWGFSVKFTANASKVSITLPRYFIPRPTPWFIQSVKAWDKQAAGPLNQQTVPNQAPLGPDLVLPAK